MIRNKEYAERRIRFQQKLLEENLDGYIVSNSNNIFYFTGATYKQSKGRFLIIFTPKGEPTFLVPKLEEEHMKKKVKIDILPYGGNISENMNTLESQLLSLLPDAKKIGIETSMILSTKLKLDKIFENISEMELKPISLVESLRLVKSPAELEMIRNSCSYAEKGMRLMIGKAYSGISVMEMYSSSRKLQMDVIKTGTFDPFKTEFLTAGWPAPHSAKPHSIPKLNQKFRKGPLAAMSIQRIDGYFAELERTFFLSPPDDKVTRMFATMREARKLALSMIKPGIKINTIDQATNGFLKDKGYGDCLLHTISHGIGIEMHENPWIGPEFDFKLAENMVISIEPGIYIPEIGGVRHSDTVLVTKDGYELLTHFPMDLDSLTIKSPRLLKKLVGYIMQKAVKMKAEDGD